MELNIEDLKYLRGSKLDDGYRLVYKKNNGFHISSYSKTIEGFICEINDYNPYSLYDEKEFVSIENLLEEISKKYNREEVYIYKIDGTLISSYNKKNKKI